MKGEMNVTTESGIVLTIIFFVTALIWLTQQMHTTFPSIEAMPDFSYLLFGAEMISIGVACNVITGLGCVAVGIVAASINFFFIPTYLQIVFLPLLAIYSYVIGRLTRGGG